MASLMYCGGKSLETGVIERLFFSFSVIICEKNNKNLSVGEKKLYNRFHTFFKNFSFKGNRYLYAW